MDTIDWIFKILQQNVQLLKYQFKRFIIGWNVNDSQHYVLKWNKEINTKYLDKLKARFNRNHTKRKTQIQRKDKYQRLTQQWSS